MKEPPGKRGNEPFHPERRHIKPRIWKPAALRWALMVTGWSFVISFALSFIANKTISQLGIIAALVVLFIFIALGIGFDILGLATATASEKPFRSMDARRVKGASNSLKLILHADQVSSFCNDVVGDIAGIISGTTCTVVASSLVNDYSFSALFTTLIVSAVVTSLTVGGKALGKSIAIAKSTEIVFFVGRILNFLESFRKKKRGSK